MKDKTKNKTKGDFASGANQQAQQMNKKYTQAAIKPISAPLFLG